MANAAAASSTRFHQQITLAGTLIAIGIVFGDIGTSPLYTLNAVFHGQTIDETIALGSLSCIFWTLTFQTTLKYVIITLKADNHGEGGIFSLYALVRRFSGKWLIYAAMAGGAFLMADGIITPPISVASAVEGLEGIYPNIQTVPIVLGILAVLFLFQQFGTNNIGKVFGPVMLFWFAFIGFLGVLQLKNDWSVLRAFNPHYAYQLLVNHPGGFWLLGSIFLCTTGAEALYSDMGHCGRNNIRLSWSFIKVMLLLNYAGQTVWLTQHIGQSVGDISPFFHTIPPSMYILTLVVATLATIIASQALISGCFTLINEAIHLGIWPRHRVEFPSNVKGQLYIPAINWFLMAGCVGMVLHFKRSTEMEAAFGLSVTLTMLMSTVLIFFYLRSKRFTPFVSIPLVLVFLTIETSFLIANLQKIKEGGWITLVIGAALFLMMYIWYSGRSIKQKLLRMENLTKYLPQLGQLSKDENIPKFATNLVYMTSSQTSKKIEHTIIDSILHKVPKRADTYWFVHLNFTDEPYTLNYSAQKIAYNDAYFISFDLGFRVEPRIDYLFRQVVDALVKSGEVNVSDRCENKYQESGIGDFKFVVSEWFLSYDNDLPYWTRFIMKSFYNLKLLSIKEGANFGLEPSNLVVERYPLVVASVRKMELNRV
jgi:KUP system potassium uptake protein